MIKIPTDKDVADGLQPPANPGTLYVNSWILITSNPIVHRTIMRSLQIVLQEIIGLASANLVSSLEVVRVDMVFRVEQAVDLFRL